MPHDYSVSWVKAFASLSLVVLVILGIHFFMGSEEEPTVVEAPPTPAPAPPEQAVATRYESLEDAPALFDPKSGKPLVYYSGSPEGAMRFFSPVAFDPETGEALKPLTREVLEEYQTAQSSAQSSREASQRAREAASFRARHVNEGALAKIGKSEHVVLVTASDASFEAALAEGLRGIGIPVRTGVLKRAVFEGSVAQELGSGSDRILERLGLSGRVGKLLLARATLETPKGSSLRGDMLNTRGTLQVSIVPLDGARPETLPTISDVGAGFDGAQAKEVATRKLIEALLRNQSMERLQ